MSTDAEPNLAPELASLEDAVAIHDAAQPPIDAPSEPVLEPTPEPTPDPVPSPDPPSDPPEDATPPDEQDSDTAFINFVRRRHPGLDLSKYRSDLEAIDGLASASRLVGQRDEYATLGKAIRASGREAEIAAFLSGQVQQPGPQAPQQPPPIASSFEEYQYLQSQIRQDDDGNLIAAPGAPVDSVQKFRAATDRMQRAMFAIAHQPEQVLQPILQQQQAAMQQQIQTQFAQQAAQRNEAESLRGWAEENRKWFYTNGDPQQAPTMLGQQFSQYFDQSREPTVEGRLRYATAVLRGMQPPTAPPAPRPQAVHKPAVGTPPAPDPDEQYKERLAKLDLAGHLALQMEDQELRSGVAG